MGETKTQQKILCANRCQPVPNRSVYSFRLDTTDPERRLAKMYEPTFTYFIRQETGGPIKIGKATNIARRISSLQSSCPVTLVCIAYVEGNFEFELHERFEWLCVGGEWFRDDPELLNFIARYATPARIARPPLTPAETRKRRCKAVYGYEAWRRMMPKIQQLKGRAPWWHAKEGEQ